MNGRLNQLDNSCTFGKLINYVDGKLNLPCPISGTKTFWSKKRSPRLIVLSTKTERNASSQPIGLSNSSGDQMLLLHSLILGKKRSSKNQRGSIKSDAVKKGRAADQCHSSPQKRTIG